MLKKYAVDSHKLMYHPERVASWIWDPENTFPVYVEISPTGNCNHRCTFCALDFMGYRGARIEHGTLVQVLCNMHKVGVRSIMFAGEGEPLLHKDLEAVCEAGKDIGLDLAITSNGVLLVERRMGILNHLKWFRFSVNGGNKTAYDWIHRGGHNDFAIVWDNIYSAVDYRGERGLGCTIGVQCLVLPDNADSIMELAERCMDAEVDYLILKPYSQHPASISHEYADSHNWIDHDRLQKIAEMYSDSRMEVIYRKDTICRGICTEERYDICRSVPYLWAYVSSDGDVFGCSAYLHRPAEFAYGNILENTFEEVWKGKKRKEAIEMMKTFDISQCRKMCRMDAVNEYLHRLDNPMEHDNFI